MEIALIGDRHTVYGFRLAGIRKTFPIEEIREQGISEALKDLFGPGIALLLVTERVAEELGDKLEEANRFKKGMLPVIVVIPDSSGPMIKKIDPIRELIKRTVGFEMA